LLCAKYQHPSTGAKGKRVDHVAVARYLANNFSCGNVIEANFSVWGNVF